MTRSLNDSWHTGFFPNEVGSIGEKIAREWLLRKGYEVYSFQDVTWKFSELGTMVNRLKRRRKQLYAERDRESIGRMESHLKDIFDDRFADMSEWHEALRKLAREEQEVRLARHYKRVGIGPDFIVKKNDDISFVEAKVNEAQPKKWQKASFQIAKEHGFKTMILRMTIEIFVGEDIQFTES